MTMGIGESSLARPQSGNEVYTDLLTFCFRGPVPYDENRPLFIDAENPSRSFSARQFRTLVRTLIAGLKAHHVQRGDCVLVHLGNNVSTMFYYVLPSSDKSLQIPSHDGEAVCPNKTFNSGPTVSKV
jgi:hypothetical protein